jgi:hypothetical protein
MINSCRNSSDRKAIFASRFSSSVCDLIHTALGIEVVRKELVLVAKFFGEECIEVMSLWIRAPRKSSRGQGKADVHPRGSAVVAVFVILAELAFVSAVFDVFHNSDQADTG